MVKGADVRVPVAFLPDPAVNPPATLPVIPPFPGPSPNASPSTVQSPYEPELKSSMKMMSSACTCVPIVINAATKQHTVPAEIALSRPISDSPLYT